MPWLISFEMWGEEFTPSRVLFPFTEQHDPGVTPAGGLLGGQLLMYGSASYVVPPSVPIGERIRHLVQTIEPVLPAILTAGATRCHVGIARFYYSQCNEEYSLEQLQLIARLGCGFTYSAYSVTEAEERELEERYENVKQVG